MPGHAAKPFGRKRIHQNQSQYTTGNRFVGRQLAELKNQRIQPAFCRAKACDEKDMSRIC